MLLAEGRLQCVQLSVLLQALDGGHLLSVALDGQAGARLDGLAVHQDGAGAAQGRLAADVGAGQVELVAQKMAEQGPWFHVR